MTVARPLAPLVLFFLGVAIVASPSVATAQSADKTYVVRFPEVTKVGDRYEVEIDARQSLKRVVREGEAVLNSQEEQVAIDLDGVVKVLEVNERQQEAATHFTVELATVTANNNKTDILAPGSEFLASAGEGDEGTVFTTTDGKDLPEIAQKVLPRVMSLGGDEFTLDKMFGSDTPRRVGETWEADKKMLVELAKSRGVATTEEKTKGTGKIDRVYNQEGQELLDLVFEIAIEVEDRESPVPQAEPVSAKLLIVQEVTITTDPKQGPLAQRVSMTMQQVLRGKEGTPLAGKTLDGENKETHSFRYKPLAD